MANTLRKLQRWPEARTAYEYLHSISPGTHTESSPWTNWKAHVPYVLIACGDAKAAKAYILRPENVDCMTYSSCILYWALAGVLLEWITHFSHVQGDAGWPSVAFTERNKKNDFEGIHRAGGGCAAVGVALHFPLLVDLIAGVEPMPTGRLPYQLSGGVNMGGPSSCQTTYATCVNCAMGIPPLPPTLFLESLS